MTDDDRAPPRLVETHGPAADCVREALAQREQVASPLPPRFALLQARRLRSVQRQRALLLVAVVGVLLGARALQRREPLPDIRAELAVNQQSRQPPPAAAPSVLPAEPPSARALSPSLPRNLESVTSPPKAVARSNRAALAPAEAPSDSGGGAVAVGGSDTAFGGGAKACAQLARNGASEQALACYAKLANGTGMSAELALFEQARLEGKALRRPDGALRTLEDYRRRFPNGSLRGEVMLAQIDWLLASGNAPRALEIVDEALASGLLRERTVELQRLRATLSAAPKP